MLFISNQSSEATRVDMTVKVDGREVFVSPRVPYNQYWSDRIELELSQGRHTLSARSGSGSASLETSFALTAEGFGAVTYWYGVRDANPDVPPDLDFQYSDKMLGFD